MASLLPDEKVLWSGQAGGGIVFQPMDLFLVPFSLVWCGFAIFWTNTVSSIGAPSFFDLWGLMFVVIGLYFVAGRFIVDAWVRSGLHYSVTNCRIVIERRGIFSRQTVVNLADLPPVSIRVGGSGRGTIRFGGSYNVWGRSGFGAWSPAFDPTPQFIQIDDAQSVFDLINRARNDLLRPGRPNW